MPVREGFETLQQNSSRRAGSAGAGRLTRREQRAARHRRPNTRGTTFELPAGSAKHAAAKSADAVSCLTVPAQTTAQQRTTTADALQRSGGPAVVHCRQLPWKASS